MDRINGAGLGRIAAGEKQEKFFSKKCKNPAYTA